jgi:23S rRNA (adenine2503-C2)-methyltransferase
MSKINLLGYTPRQLEDLMVAFGHEAYHGRQLFKWLYKLRQHDFSLITDLSKDLRQRLQQDYDFQGLAMDQSVLSADGTRKFLFRLDDGLAVESVLIPEDVGRRTVCVSSQVGCPLGCRFCATGTVAPSRNLTVGEIVGQLIYIRDHFGEAAFTNIVLMGMGEPLLNLDSVAEAVKIISAGDGLSVSAKKITVSTAGLVTGIRKLADLKLKVRLAVSLNAAIQEKRAALMPVAKTYPLDELMAALRYYTDKTKSRVTLEYILFRGCNDSMEDVLALSRLVRGVPCKINLLAYNPVEGLDFERPSEEVLDWFARQLYPRTPAVTVRRSRGVDIDAACGQLAAKRTGRRDPDA